VQTRAQKRDFHRLVAPLYAGDPNFVPPLLLERHMHFSAKHNPFFQHAKVSLWVAYRDGRPAGRISAQIDDLHLERYRDATGHFGFIEAVDDRAVFAGLLEQAERWLREQGIKRVFGPVSFSMWDQPGLLVDGFETPPSVLMGHAMPYFAAHIEAAGYTPLQDLLAYAYDYPPLPPVAERTLTRAMRQGSITIREVRKDRRNFDSDLALILDILNDGWSDNWGFVPMTAAEAAELGTLLRFLIPANQGAIAEHNGQAAAFALVVPNINEAIRDLGGRLAPFGWAKLIWRLKCRGLKTGRMVAMGVRKELAASPIGAALALSVIAATRATSYANGIRDGELSWVLDANRRARHIIEMVGARAYKRYRIYQKPLD
jgi:GNAT superfamily N-acetyltransferase